MEKKLTFTINRKDVLNSNSIAGMHYFQKGKISSRLRSIGYDMGLENTPEKDKNKVISRKKVIEKEENRKLAKSRITKNLKKNNKEITPKELKELAEKKTSESFGDVEIPSSDMSVNPQFNYFKVKVKVSPPTKRRLDPVNLYPTVKNLVDGLTDAAFWVDDDWEHLTEMSFVYGQVNDTKDSFVITLEISEND